MQGYAPAALTATFSPFLGVLIVISKRPNRKKEKKGMARDGKGKRFVRIRRSHNPACVKTQEGMCHNGVKMHLKSRYQRNNHVDEDGKRLKGQEPGEELVSMVPLE